MLGESLFWGLFECAKSRDDIKALLKCRTGRLCLLGTVFIEDALLTAFRDLGISVRGTISSKEVEQDRPLLKGPPSEQLVNEMRRKRVAEGVF